tara:strand:+ start:21 stop:704 length:684 start_codon:yes stop_codon:yes gene_type:complete
MCDPISIAVGSALGATGSATAVGMVGASTLIGAGSSIAGYAGQRQQAKQQAAYQAQSIAAAQRKAGFQRTSQILESQQKQLALAQEKGKVTKAAREQLASATVSAGEAGVSGLSVQALMDDYVRQQAGQQVALTTQEKLYGLQRGMGLRQLGLASEQEILGLSQPIEKPSLLSAGLGAVSGGLSGYRTGLDIGSRMKKPSSVIPKGTISGSTASYAPGTPGGRYLKY